jgi:cytochrome c-type biogenesis protein CcmH/NrfG
VVRSRPREAQECLDLGKGELEAGRASSALAHLRRALQLAPGDSEIAGWIGRALKGAPPKAP